MEYIIDFECKIELLEWSILNIENIYNKRGIIKSDSLIRISHYG